MHNLKMPPLPTYTPTPCLLLLRQVIADESADAFLKNRRKDQERAVEELRSMRAFQDLDIILAPQFDLEVRGLPALDYFGRQVWTSRDEGQ